MPDRNGGLAHDHRPVPDLGRDLVRGLRRPGVRSARAPPRWVGVPTAMNTTSQSPNRLDLGVELEIAGFEIGGDDRRETRFVDRDLACLEAPDPFGILVDADDPVAEVRQA